jgi:membrane associated rhomboid family serine protease
MIPLRDTQPSATYPVVTHSIIGINVVVYLIQLAQGPGVEQFIYVYGLVPARYSVEAVARYFSTGQQLLSLISFMFLHGGFLHLLGNMWSLYIFGDNVEERLGPVRYLAFYILCGLASGASHLISDFHGNVPVIGASGAIAGVMGAYVLIHPRARILTLVPLLFIPLFFEIPAYFFLGFWFLMQFINAAGSQGAGSGIAWWAHIGGFLFGMFALKAFELMPPTGINARLRQATVKRHTNRLQVIRPVGPDREADLYGTILVTPYEAAAGTRKTVNIPWGFQKRLIRVTVPPGVSAGQKLRLQGLGRRLPDGRIGDLYLKVAVQP